MKALFPAGPRHPVLPLLALALGIALGRLAVRGPAPGPARLPGAGTGIEAVTIVGPIDRTRLRIECSAEVTVRWKQDPERRYRLRPGRLSLPVPTTTTGVAELEAPFSDPPGTLPVPLGDLDRAAVKEALELASREDPVARVRDAFTRGKPPPALLASYDRLDTAIFPRPPWDALPPGELLAAWRFHQRVNLARELAATEATRAARTAEDQDEERSRVPLAALEDGWPEAVVVRGRELGWQKPGLETEDGRPIARGQGDLRLVPPDPKMDIADLSLQSSRKPSDLYFTWPREAPPDPVRIVVMVLVAGLGSNELLVIDRDRSPWLDVWNDSPSLGAEDRPPGWISVAVPGVLAPRPGERLRIRLAPVDLAFYGSAEVRALRIGWVPASSTR